MRRPPFLVTLSLFVAAAILAACAGDGAPLPTAASSAPGISAPSFNRTPVPCRSVGDDFMEDLFPRSMWATTVSRMIHIHLLMRQGKTAQARTEMFQLWDIVLRAYYAGQLKGGKSLSTQNTVIQYGQLLYCQVGLDGSGLTLGDPLGSGGNQTVVVFPSSTTNQDVVHGSGNAGIRFFAGSLTQPVTATVSAITTSFGRAGPLHTKLDQYGPFFEFHVIPESNLNAQALVAECLVAPVGDPPSTVHLAHNVGTGIEILPKEPSFLNCTGTIGMAPSAGELLARHDFTGALKRLGEGALSLVTPEPAWAGGVGTGGKVKSFSPFGGVDTLVVMEGAAPLFQTAPTGSAVPVPPKVVVHTTGAGTLLDGAVITFNVTFGAGSLTAIGGAGPVSSVVATTDATGSAAVASWVLGVSYDTVKASGAFPAPPTGSGVGIGGSPVSFGAIGGDVIPWQAAGYRYSSGPAGSAAGFEAAGFDDSGWSIGQAGFGSATPSTLICPLNATVATPWALGSVEAPSDVLPPAWIGLPAGWTADLTLSVAIDNDIQVFVNGTDVTATASPAVDLVGGMVPHENCAARGSSTFTLSHTLLHSGANVIAIRARDRGVDAFVDAQVTVPTP